MTLLNTYLSNSRVKKVLSRKPGQEGFSLIELVVVVAVLAVLSAIAIPAFDDISQKARATAAANTIAQTVKECAVKIADQGSGTFLPAVNLSGYMDASKNSAGFYINTSRKANSTAVACVTSGFYELKSEDTTKYPSFKYNFDATGNKKTCTAATGSKAVGRVCQASGEW